jgi:hypothetical protein
MYGRRSHAAVSRVQVNWVQECSPALWLHVVRWSWVRCTEIKMKEAREVRRAPRAKNETVRVVQRGEGDCVCCGRGRQRCSLGIIT